MINCEDNQSCEVWELEILDETSLGLLVSAPNGDTQWMSREEYNTYLENRKANNQN
jgi:hypothetical protein